MLWILNNVGTSTLPPGITKSTLEMFEVAPWQSIWYEEIEKEAAELAICATHGSCNFKLMMKSEVACPNKHELKTKLYDTTGRSAIEARGSNQKETCADVLRLGCSIVCRYLGIEHTHCPTRSGCRLSVDPYDTMADNGAPFHLYNGKRRGLFYCIGTVLHQRRSRRVGENWLVYMPSHTRTTLNGATVRGTWDISNHTHTQITENDWRALQGLGIVGLGKFSGRRSRCCQDHLFAWLG